MDSGSTPDRRNFSSSLSPLFISQTMLIIDGNSNPHTCYGTVNGETQIHHSDIFVWKDDLCLNAPYLITKWI